MEGAVVTRESIEYIGGGKRRETHHAIEKRGVCSKSLERRRWENREKISGRVSGRYEKIANYGPHVNYRP